MRTPLTPTQARDILNIANLEDIEDNQEVIVYVNAETAFAILRKIKRKEKNSK